MGLSASENYHSPMRTDFISVKMLAILFDGVSVNVASRMAPTLGSAVSFNSENI